MKESIQNVQKEQLGQLNERLLQQDYVNSYARWELLFFNFAQLTPTLLLEFLTATHSLATPALQFSPPVKIYALLLEKDKAIAALLTVNQRISYYFQVAKHYEAQQDSRLSLGYAVKALRLAETENRANEVNPLSLWIDAYSGQQQQLLRSTYLREQWQSLQQSNAVKGIIFYYLKRLP